MKKKVVVIIVILTILLFVIVSGIIIKNKLETNETYYKDVYIGIFDEEIFIPKHSYFVSECCMTAATFYSLRSEKELQEEIDNYLKDFTYFENENTYGYQKDDLFIQSYEAINKGLYRVIYIVY